MNKRKTCAFTGHRELENDIDLPYLKECVQGIIDRGYETFLCGMAWGFDLLAAQAVLELKEDNPQIKLIACVPCPGQEKNFPEEEKIKYKEIIESATKCALSVRTFIRAVCTRATDTW